MYKKRPPVQVMAGILLLLLSYVIGWPAIGVLGLLAVCTGKPLILAIGGPLMYGVSHVVFLIGMYYAGKDYAAECLKRVKKAWKERK